MAMERMWNYRATKPIREPVVDSLPKKEKKLGKNSTIRYVNSANTHHHQGFKLNHP
jgi:hypothetical protein